jgi:hypothetical protein
MDELFPLVSGVVLGIVVAGLRPSLRLYQRNADFATQTLLGTDNTSPGRHLDRSVLRPVHAPWVVSTDSRP